MTEHVRVSAEMTLEWRYSPGAAMARFRQALRAGRILATRCDGCGTRYLPPRPVCGDCGLALSAWVEVAEVGTVLACTVVHVPIVDGRTGLPREVPYAMALVRRDGADSTLNHFILGEGASDEGVSGEGLAIGSRVRARWREERTGSLDDLEGFEVVPADAPEVTPVVGSPHAGEGQRGNAVTRSHGRAATRLHGQAEPRFRGTTGRFAHDSTESRTAVHENEHRIRVSRTSSENEQQDRVSEPDCGRSPGLRPTDRSDATAPPDEPPLVAGLHLEFRYAAGRLGSRFLVALRDEGTLLGATCPDCGVVSCPPRPTCPRCGAGVTDLVPVGPEATLLAAVPRPGAPALGLVRPDGATTGMLHRLLGPPEAHVPGARLRLVLAETRTASILTIAGFAPTGPRS